MGPSQTPDKPLDWSLPKADLVSPWEPPGIQLCPPRLCASEVSSGPPSVPSCLEVLDPLPALHLLPVLGQNQIQWTLLPGNWEWLVQLVSRGLGALGSWEGTGRMQKQQVVTVGPGGTLGWEPGNCGAQGVC